ncbi:LicD family protein [Enterococcus devriesei]|nr:LicD family protein [Enterococcus devriesei]MBU5366298.1 LicD family protein [Enterococcus devriesei]
MLYETYDEETLKQLQQIELDILREFDKLCNDHDLDYFLIGGSAIGAIRHQGIIPWDDDIDVGMNRKDYDKFLEIAKQDFSDNYTVVNNETNPNFPLMNTRWGLNGTKFKTKDLKNVPGNFGIFLDIFCFDNVSDDERKMKIQITLAWLYGKLSVLSVVDQPVLYIDGWKKQIILLMSKSVHVIFNLLSLKPTFFYKKAKKYMLKYQNEETEKMAYMFEPQRYISVARKKDVYPTKRIKFESFDAKVPNNIEKFLKKRYGDYMTLPPEEKRHNHPPYELKLK